MIPRIEITREFPVEAEALFRLCAAPEFFRRLGVRPDTGFADFRPGGRFEYELPNGRRLWGQVLEFRPAERFVLSWWTDDPTYEMRDTRVTLDLRPRAEGTELTLVHDGFVRESDRADHHDGWQDLLGALEVDLKGPLGAALASGLALEFRFGQRFAVPVARLYEAFQDPAQLCKFFVQESSGPLQPDAVVRWRFAGLDRPLVVHVCEVVPGETLRFAWGHARVEFRFERVEEGSRLTVHCTGWPPTPAALKDSYEECEGWRQVLCAAKAWLEHGVSI